MVVKQICGAATFHGNAFLAYFVDNHFLFIILEKPKLLPDNKARAFSSEQYPPSPLSLHFLFYTLSAFLIYKRARVAEASDMRGHDEGTTEVNLLLLTWM